MCPLWKKPCAKVKECNWRRRGMRFYDDGRKPEPFEQCAIDRGIDLLENLVQRSIGQQAAMEGVRNKTDDLLGFFEKLATIKALERKDG